MRALPLKHPAHALRCPSQSGDLKVKCPSNRTLNVNGPLIYIFEVRGYFSNPIFVQKVCKL